MKEVGTRASRRTKGEKWGKGTRSERTVRVGSERENRYMRKTVREGDLMIVA